MAITRSAKKAIRSAARKRVFNLRRKNAIQDVTKQIRKLVAAGKKKEAQALLPKAYQALDKAAKTNYLKKNAAARKKSRLAALIKKSK
ncbi:30S ribosomal protein S20 [Candidatus Kaiserbacteria bacterium RIFCSPHIGHO2_01_FULL_49_13]|uniref:Small ribosomal subunit protein bS20 n=1 Tax=Candidatus Kaiserbacteria bacterium RIFCSPHIGHO2_01_FULL_49_13 TaxID=1798477 RepID=A0A1F6CDU5_9BACT|nr:MAG: 30S ribosomal protein S20 [Candidatus Kaiserbacteria bacterium RIFCSPHIGHO2_01_FULL_49_13]